jgi:DNA-binding MarR family transcriptional regulator
MSLHQGDAPSANRRPSAAWRLRNAGRILSDAVTRFESRVMELMERAGYTETRLSHINLTRHLDLDGTRITDLARRAGMTNAAMTELVDQCEAIGLVERTFDSTDRRARVVQFTDEGRQWLAAFGKAVKKAEGELVKAIGPEAFDLLFGPLARYAGGVRSLGSAGDA